MQRLVDPMEFESIISATHLKDQILQLLEGEAVQFVELVIGKSIPRGIKTRQVTQQKTAGVADPPVRFAQPLEDVR